MAEKQNNAVATAGNIAHKLHGTAQIVRGAVTADFLAVASGATKVPILICCTRLTNRFYVSETAFL